MDDLNKNRSGEASGASDTDQRPSPLLVATWIKRLALWRETAGFGAILLAAAIGVLVLGWVYATGGFSFLSADVRRKAPVASVAAAPSASTGAAVRRAIDGTPEPQSYVEPDYAAVMIDNIADAMPQSGVAKAPLVIEAPVEGGLTRLMAVFPLDASVGTTGTGASGATVGTSSGSLPAKIGPIRSARPYYVDWAEEFGALYTHVGGSPAALDQITSSDLRDLNEFFYGSSFWRDTARKAPHNAYTSMDKLRAAVAARPRILGTLPSWKYKDDALAADRPDGLTVRIGDVGHWHVSWVYDPTTDSFARKDGAASLPTQRDADGSPVQAKAVLVQFTEVRTLDDVGRRSVDTVSGGDALVIMDGTVIGGRWKKSGGRTRFYDAAGHELAIVAGTAWIEVIPTGTEVTY